MERRTSYRKAIQHDAIVKLKGGAKWPCTIADFCDKGMFITYSLSASKAIAAALSGESQQEFRVNFLGDRGEEYEIPVAVTRKIECATGLKFLENNEAAFDALVSLSASQKGHKNLGEDTKPIVAACVKEIVEFADTPFHEVFPLLEQALKEEAVAAPSDQEANMLMELSQKLERLKTDMIQKFMAALANPVQFVRSQYSQQNEVKDQLSLIDKNEFEDWLTSRVLITKAESSYHELLLPLKTRLDAIGLALEDRKHSLFGPELFVLGYREAISPLILNGQIERLLFKVFENSFMQKLEPLYETLNNLLIKQGVLPDLNLAKQVRKAPSPKIPKPREESKKPEQDSPQQAVEENPLQSMLRSLPPTQAPYGAAPRQQVPGGGAPEVLPSAEGHSLSDLSAPFQPGPQGEENTGGFEHNHQQAEAAFERARELIQSLHHSTSTDEDSVAVQQAQMEEKYSKDELQKGLTSMQVSAAELTHDADERKLLERVLGNLSESAEAEKGIDEEQQVAIDVVDRFFVSLKRNPRLTVNAIDQLHRLEVPVLKVLLQEENFFAASNHSVRQVMNRIAQLGAKGARINPSVQAKIESLVRQIIDNFDDDTSVFDEVLAQLDEMVERQSKLYSKNVERVAAAAEGVHRVDEAKAAVVKALQERLGGREIPKAVQTLIDHGWKDLLNLIHIKHGGDSKEWDEHLEIVDTLLRFSETPESQLDMKKLLPKIQEGLRTVSGNDRPPLVVREDLKKLIQEAPTRQQEMVQPVLEEVEESDDVRESRNAKILKELKPWIRRVRAIKPGSWLKLSKDPEDIQYMRLVWVAKGYSKFVFVNHQGMKVIELGLFKFARYLKDQVISPDPDYELPIVNQGLDDMIKDVYDKLAFESSHDDASRLLNYGESCRQIRKLMSEGDRDASCGMHYLRMEEKTKDTWRAPSKPLASKVGKALRGLTSESSVVGRLNLHDFVIFSFEDDFDLLSVRLVEQLAILRDQTLPDEPEFRFELGEHKASFGFNNPESMFEAASQGLEPIGDGEDEAKPSSEVIRGVAVKTDSSEELIEASNKMMDLEPQFADVKQHYRFPDGFFELYFQRAVGISEKSAEQGQCELLCSEKGTGLSYVPEVRAEAAALDQWWLDALYSHFQDSTPGWDGLGEVRIKLSGYALNDDGVTEVLLNWAEEIAVNPEEIWFDIYDSAVIDDVHAAAERMSNLVALGYRFCLDQFGTVRAPFYLMKSLPVQMVKIDEGYVDVMNREDANEGPTGSVVEVAHYLGRHVLVSSVDSAICLQRMRKLGIDYAQGTTIADYEKLDA